MTLVLLKQFEPDHADLHSRQIVKVYKADVGDTPNSSAVNSFPTGKTLTGDSGTFSRIIVSRDYYANDPEYAGKSRWVFTYRTPTPDEWLIAHPNTLALSGKGFGTRQPYRYHPNEGVVEGRDPDDDTPRIWRMTLGDNARYLSGQLVSLKGYFDDTGWGTYVMPYLNACYMSNETGMTVMQSVAAIGINPGDIYLHSIDWQPVPHQGKLRAVTFNFMKYDLIGNCYSYPFEERISRQEVKEWTGIGWTSTGKYAHVSIPHIIGGTERHTMNHGSYDFHPLDTIITTKL